MGMIKSKCLALTLVLGLTAIAAGLLVRPLRAWTDPCPRQIDPSPSESNKQSRFAATHRILVLDIHDQRGDEGELLLIEVESGKVLARLNRIEQSSDLSVSPQGELVAIFASNNGHRSLEVLRAGDLTRLQFGVLPPSIRQLRYINGASRDCRFTPDGQQILVQSIESVVGPAHWSTTVLISIERKLDDTQTFRRGPRSGSVWHSNGFQVVRVADWPRVHIWNPTLGLLLVADLKSGKFTSKYYLGDDPEALKLDPSELEKGDDRLVLRLRAAGSFVASGRYGYYIPRQPWNKNEPRFLKKVDLGVDPPKVVLTGKNAANDLHPVQTAVSEPAGIFFVVQAEYPKDSRHQPSRRLKMYGTQDLKLQSEIDLPLADCQGLEVSADGKYLYVLSSTESKVAVLDAATAKVVKVLEKLGEYPQCLLAVPEAEK